MTLTLSQVNRASEIFGNLSVAWFSVGVIAPLFTQPQQAVILGFSSGVSLVMSGLSFALSLQLAKELDV